MGNISLLLLSSAALLLCTSRATIMRNANVHPFAPSHAAHRTLQNTWRRLAPRVSSLIARRRQLGALMSKFGVGGDRSTDKKGEEDMLVKYCRQFHIGSVCDKVMQKYGEQADDEETYEPQGYRESDLTPSGEHNYRNAEF